MWAVQPAIHSLCGLCHEAVWTGFWAGIQSGWWCPICASPHTKGGRTPWGQLPPTWRSSLSQSKCICVHSVFGAADLWHPDQATATALSPAITTLHHGDIQCDCSHISLYLISKTSRQSCCNLPLSPFQDLHILSVKTTEEHFINTLHNIKETTYCSLKWWWLLTITLSSGAHWISCWCM